MNKFIRCAAFALMLFSAPGSAQDYEAGVTAFGAGDYATAGREWMPLAEQGNAMAQSSLGDLYRLGLGVPLSYTEAVKWYRLAAEQGGGPPQFMLGVMHQNGYGVPQDFVTAHMWFNISATNGTGYAAVERDNVKAMMTPADISEAQRRASACMASNYQDCDPARGWWFWPF